MIKLYSILRNLPLFCEEELDSEIIQETEPEVDMLRPYSSQTSVGVITGDCAEYDLDDDEDEERLVHLPLCMGCSRLYLIT